MTPRPHLLIVDDEAGIRESLSSILNEEGYHVEAVGSAEEALDRASAGDLEVMLLDVWLPGMDGLEALSRLQATPRPPAVIMISGHGTIETAVRATKLGAFDFIEKPLSIEKIVVLVRNAVQQRRLEEENQFLRTELGHRYQVIGESVPMKALRQQIAVTAPTNGRVLIYGESGTGKELVAKAIHYTSPRVRQPFVALNCAALPETLLESELFGIEKGVATGVNPRVGHFQRADGGTLFLDEIGDLSLTAQAKILRVLQERVVERVGGRTAIPVDVRVLAATNKDLDAEIAKAAFREDLFYRIKVIHIHMPPLRDIREEIPLLANHFLKEYCRELGRGSMEFSPDVMRKLAAAAWPGNVRQLRNEVMRLAACARHNVIEDDDLLEGLPSPRPVNQPAKPLKPESLKKAVADLEKRMISEALQSTRNNQQQAAKTLGLSRQGLINKMKRYAIAG